MNSALAQDSRHQVLRTLRRKRRRAAQHQQRRRVLGGAAALALAATSALGVASFTGTDLAGAAVARTQDLMQLLERRSPGQRSEGQLTKTKARHAELADRLPASPEAPVPVKLTDIIARPAMVPAGFDIPTPPPALELFEPPLPRGGSVFLIATGDIPGGGGGGGGIPPGQQTPPNTPPNAPSAVPEPGTWMTMLAGFAMIGAALRRKRRTLSLAI